MRLRISGLAAGEWVMLTWAGMLLAGGAHFPGDFGTSYFSLAALDLGAALVGFVFGAISGLMIAGLQAFVLKAWGRGARAWVWLNALGYGLVHALADGIAYQPLVVVAGGVILAACQYLALRPVMSRSAWWLPLATGAWWLGFGLGAGSSDYNRVVAGLIFGGATGLGLRLLFLPTARPEATRLAWAELSRAQKLRLALISLLVVILAVVFAMLTGLIGL